MLKSNKIYHGDCLSLFPKLSDDSVDLIISDPPYGINKDFGNNKRWSLSDIQEWFDWTKLWLTESFRVLKKNGAIVGFVPFLVNVHPDPHDFFRYSDECLNKIFKSAGFNKINIKVIGQGPLIVNFNNLVTIFPKILSIILFPFYYYLDLLLVKIKPSIKKRFPLGYLFVLKKQ